MKIVALTDIHAKPEAVVAIAEELRAADLVLLPGDLTMFGREDDARAVLDAIRPYNDRFLAVMGNCDFPEVEQHLTECGISIHRAHHIVDGIAFIGLGGSLPCPLPTLNEWSEEEIEAHLAAAVEGLPRDTPAILVSHQPPVDTVVDLAGIGTHVGSASVRTFIEERQPIVCFSGHIHEAQGTDAIGRTTLVNPGPFLEGRYAWVEVVDGACTVDIRRAPGLDE